MNHGKTYIVQPLSVPLKGLVTMFGLEKLIARFKRDPLAHIELPPGAIVFPYNPEFDKVTKDDLREMLPEGPFREAFEELTGISLAREPIKKGAIPPGAILFPCDEPNYDGQTDYQPKDYQG